MGKNKKAINAKKEELQAKRVFQIVVVALIMVEEIVKSVLVMLRLFSNKWIKNVVNEF